MIKEIKNTIKKFQHSGEITPAIVTQDPEFNKFLMTLPDNQRLTPEEDYHTYQYWKINGKPKDFSEALNLGMYHYDSSDNSYHANSVAFNSKGVGHFMKPKHHSTVKYELDWYNKGIGTLEGGKQYPLQGEERKEWEDFRSQYQLDSTGVDYKYVPRKQNGGSILDFILNKNTIPTIVGGISYNSVYNNQPIDIYGDPIDLAGLTSYYHTPTYIGEEIPSGYQKQYNFNIDSDSAENPDALATETSSVTTPTTPVTPTTPTTPTPAPAAVTPIIVETPSDPVIVPVSTPIVEQRDVAPETGSKTTSKLVGKEGFKKLIKLYEVALEKRGIDKIYAKWLASKDALETGWGQFGHGVEHLNYGNITAGSNWSGKTYEGGDRDARGNKIKQKFRAYDSIEDYIEDQLNLYNLKRYKNIFIGDPSEFADRLYEAGYAVDPKYAKKIKAIYNSW